MPNELTGLPSHGLPVRFRKYQASGVPKSRERVHVGRSNRSSYEAQKRESLEKLFSATHSGSRLSTGLRHAASYYASEKMVNDVLRERRRAAHLLRGGGEMTNELSAIEPPARPLPPSAPLRKSTASYLDDLESHPVTDFLSVQNKVGKGHQIQPENFFLASLTPNYRPLPDPPHSQMPKRPFIISESRQFAKARGGGTLEYNDPAYDDYSHNPVVAKFDITHDPHVYRNAKGEPIKIPWRDQPLADAAAAEVNPATEECLEAREFSSEQESLETPYQCAKFSNTYSSTISSSASECDWGPIFDPPRDPTEYRNKILPRDEWVTSYVPRARPWDVTPCLGRCGYSDKRVTFDRVQAFKNSAMFPSSKEQYTSVAHEALDTPSNWQKPIRGIRRYPHIPR